MRTLISALFLASLMSLGCGEMVPVSEDAELLKNAPPELLAAQTAPVSGQAVAEMAGRPDVASVATLPAGIDPSALQPRCGAYTVCTEMWSVGCVCWMNVCDQYCSDLERLAHLCGLEICPPMNTGWTDPGYPPPDDYREIRAKLAGVR